MAPAPTQTAVKPTKISFTGKTKMDPYQTVLVSGQGVVFEPEKECILHFDNEKVFGTRCVWLAAKKETVLYPVATSETTNIYVRTVEAVVGDGPDGNTG